MLGGGGSERRALLCSAVWQAGLGAAGRLGRRKEVTAECSPLGSPDAGTRRGRAAHILLNQQPSLNTAILSPDFYGEAARSPSQLVNLILGRKKKTGGGKVKS